MLPVFLNMSSLNKHDCFDVFGSFGWFRKVWEACRNIQETSMHWIKLTVPSFQYLGVFATFCLFFLTFVYAQTLIVVVLVVVNFLVLFGHNS